jgi:asparagine synthase (glutamine-hydrolysing)
MCGIFGILLHNADGMPDRCGLERSAGLMQHRGPDRQGIYVDEGIGLVHTRLSLLDLHPRSNQPFWDSDGRYALVYNGEIYNYRELRSELEEQGIDFKTTSDTEVLLESLIHYGAEATLRRLEGMFAFALYDTRERLLTLARDRFGIKPLYVYDQRDSFVFASEIAAMRPWIRFEPDLLSIAAYLENQRQGLANGFSFFKGIKIATPGSVITVRRGGQAQYGRFFSLGEFWDAAEGERLKRLKASQVVDEVEQVLLESVNKQLLADAPVGALCSGGIDSSLVVAMASKSHKNLAIFHADVIGPTSEYEAATALAKHLKLDLKTVKVSDDDSIEMMPDVMAHYGYPFTRHPESVPFLMVSRLARNNGVKAVLTGEGADECYIGYQWSLFDLRGFVRELPVRTYHALPKLIRLLLQSKYRRLIRELRTLAAKSSRVYQARASVTASSLYHRCEREIEYEDICGGIRRFVGRPVDANEVISLKLISDILRTLLHRNDCLGMAASIESRFPFLDSRLVKLAVNMPYQYKVRFSPAVVEREHLFLRDKWVLRKVAERYLPPVLSQRKKLGFPVNAHSRMDIGTEFFDDSLVANMFELDRRTTRYWVDRASREVKRRLLYLEVWAHVCLHDAPRETILAKLRKHVRVRPPNQQQAS